MRNAVSEVTGYIYIFGIVMAVLAIVFVQVNNMVEDMKRSVLSQSLEKSFKRIQYIVYSVAFGDVPSQVAEIELQGGNMFLSKGPEFIVAFVNSSNTISQDDCNEITSSGEKFRLYCLNLSTGLIYPNTTSCNVGLNRTACILNTTAGELRYEYKDWLLSMEAGAVFSKYSNAEYSKLLYEPRILLNTTAGTSKYLVITIPSLQGNLSIGGSGRFKFTVEELDNIFSKIDDLNIGSNHQWKNFDYAYVLVRDTEHQSAWCRFFDRFELLNTTLIAENCHNCYGISPCVCTCEKAF
ncbi:MAG: hypothetical protein QW581_05125, partial [Archaeoglobaceae archaeon]